MSFYTLLGCIVLALVAWCVYAFTSLPAPVKNVVTILCVVAMLALAFYGLPSRWPH